jgi:cAMP phosphodiesterase
MGEIHDTLPPVVNSIDSLQIYSFTDFIYPKLTDPGSDRFLPGKLSNYTW